MLRRSLAIAFLLLAALERAPADVLPDDSISKIVADTSQLTHPASRDSRFKQYVGIKGTDAGGFVVPGEADYGFLVNGADVLIVPLISSGSGGVFFTLLYTGIAKKHARFIGYVPSASGHLDVHIAGGLLRVVTPVYEKSDANCCPSGHNTVVYTLEGVKLKKLTEFKSK